MLEVRDLPRRGRRSREEIYKQLGTFPGEHAAASEYLGASTNGRTHYLADTRTTDTAALVAIDSESGESTVLARHPKASLTNVLWSRQTREPLAVQFNYDKPHWHVLDKSVARDIRVLRKKFRDAFDILSRDNADRHWVLSVWRRCTKRRGARVC